MPSRDNVIPLDYDKALAAAREGLPVTRSGGGQELSVADIQRRYTEDDTFQIVEREVLTEIVVRKGAPSMPYRFAPNPNYEGQLICEVGWQSAFEQMMQVPTVFQWATELEHERDATTVLQAVADNPGAWAEALKPVFQALGITGAIQSLEKRLAAIEDQKGIKAA